MGIMRLLLYFSVVLGTFLVVLAYHPDLLIGPATFGYQPEAPESLLSHLVTPTSAVGAAVVFIFYWFRFKQWTGTSDAPPGFRPHPTSHSTTWLRYVIWASIYAGIMVSVYSFVILFPQVLINLNPFFEHVGIQLPALEHVAERLKQGNLGPDDLVPYALIITLIGWAGLAEKRESQFRRRMQSLALIPTEGNSLVNRMGCSFPPFEAKQGIVKDLTQWKGRNLIVPEDFAAGSSLAERLARCVYVNHRLNSLHNEEGKTVANRHKTELADIGEAIEKLLAETEKVRDEQYDFLKHLKASDRQKGSFEKVRAELLAANGAADFNLSRLQQWLDEYGNSEPYAMRYFQSRDDRLGDSLNGLLTRLYQLAVCSVLGIAHSPGFRHKLFRNLGFDMKDPFGPRLRKEPIFKAILALGGTIFFSSAVYYFIFGFGLNGEAVAGDAHQFLPGSLGEVAIWTVWGVAMHLLGVTGGYWMERSYDITLSESSEEKRSEMMQQNHTANYVEAFAFAVTLNIFLFAIITTLGTESGSAETFRSLWIWALIPGVTGAFTSFYMRHASKDSWKPCQFALMQGAATALAAGFVLLVRYDALSQEPYANGLEGFDDFVVYSLLTTFIVGGALAIVLQDWIVSENRAVIDRSKINEKRKSPRHAVNKTGDWVAQDTDPIQVQLYDLSKHGARLKVKPRGHFVARTVNFICPSLFDYSTQLTDVEGAQGQLALGDGRQIKARVVRHVKGMCSCLEFLDPVVANRTS
jgi:hypothetical protein